MIVGDVFAFKWDYHLFADAQIYFGAGIVAYLLKDRSWREAAPVAAILLTFAYACYYKLIPVSFKYAGVAFAFGCAALIVALIDAEKMWQVPRPLVVLGDASYSLYLWHWMVLVYVGGWREKFGGSPELWRWIFVAVSIGVALLSYRTIERLFNYLGHHSSKRVKLSPAG